MGCTADPVSMLRMARIAAGLGVALMCCAGTMDLAADALPSWRDGPSKRALTEFVDRITDRSDAAYVAPDARIAAFDNDGTLWAEQPIYFQFAFAIDRVKALAGQHPEWRTTQPFKAVLEGDLHAAVATGNKGLLEILAASHAGMTTEEFHSTVMQWLATARHPSRGRPYTELAYQPMRELLDYLRANGFKTFIVSGGGVEFMRAFAQRVYGIPPEQVVGSSGVTTFHSTNDGKAVLIKAPKVEFIDDGPGKPSGIQRFIGRRPILAVGNSDGDQEMLEWTVAGDGMRLAVLIHHTDAEREYAYDRNSHVGRLDKALDEATARNWVIVDMKQDWRTVFPAVPSSSD